MDWTYMCSAYSTRDLGFKTNWFAKDFQKWLKKRYILQNTANKQATIVSMDDLLYTNCKNMAEYRSKYYVLKANIIEQNITIKDAIKIQMLKNLGFIFKTYFTIINNQMQKKKKLDEDKTLFKVIEKEKT